MSIFILRLFSANHCTIVYFRLATCPFSFSLSLLLWLCYSTIHLQIVPLVDWYEWWYDKRSLKYIKNNKGPKTLPCGTTNFTVLEFDLCLISFRVFCHICVISTICFLLCSYRNVISSALTHMPYMLNFCISNPMVNSVEGFNYIHKDRAHFVFF